MLDPRHLHRRRSSWVPCLLRWQRWQRALSVPKPSCNYRLLCQTRIGPIPVGLQWSPSRLCLYAVLFGYATAYISAAEREGF